MQLFPPIRAAQYGSPGILRPGLSVLPPGCERYHIGALGSLTVKLRAGDRVEVIDREGLQPCELLAFDAEGCCRPELLGDAQGIAGAQMGDATGARRLLTREGTALAAALQFHGLSLRGMRSIDLFGAGSKAGETACFTVQEDGTLIVAAPGTDMAVDAQDPPTDLEVFLWRADPSASALPVLPEPLAEPRLDFRIVARTAQSYEIEAGQWIEVIDVEGRQCSDFQAFAVDSLERGVERCLDVTTTRTLMGQGYPGPGTNAKYYDQDFRPLVEIVQDNCLRHDAFGLACTAKYYEDMGYPGHVNCSDNFNATLDPFGIAYRRGWMAMNFFYNTGIDDGNQFYLDEPWSRPGDRVLMQALTDLVCVSSACPCDIDAANGWNPTDIHVRVYDKKERFKRSIGFRKSAEAMVEMTKETGFHERTSKITRDFVEYNGYWLPNSYVNHGPIAEYWACRQKAVVLDLSALRKFEVLGPDSETLLQRCLTRNVRKLAVGQVVYSAMCYDTGTMIDDGTLFRLGQDNFRWIGGCDYGGEWLRKQAKDMGLEVWIKSSTDQLNNLSVQGPLSREILEKVIWTPPLQPSVAELGWFRFSIGRIGDHDGIPLILSRTGYTGELGYEIWCHPKDAPAVWDAVWTAGQPMGMLPLGLAALDMLRIEAGLIFAGYEFDDQTDPFEAGIGFAVPLKSKDEDFIGSDALRERKEHAQRKLVGLVLDGEEAAQHGDCVHIDRQQVGVVTSGTKSPILKKNIALCRMAVQHAEPGMRVEVGKLDGHQKRLPATVVALSFYDPGKERVRM